MDYFINEMTKNYPIKCAANQFTGFYKRATLALNGLI